MSNKIECSNCKLWLHFDEESFNLFQDCKNHYCLKCLREIAFGNSERRNQKTERSANLDASEKTIEFDKTTTEQKKFLQNRILCFFSNSNTQNENVKEQKKTKAFKIADLPMKISFTADVKQKSIDFDYCSENLTVQDFIDFLRLKFDVFFSTSNKNIQSFLKPVEFDLIRILSIKNKTELSENSFRKYKTFVPSSFQYMQKTVQIFEEITNLENFSSFESRISTLQSEVFEIECFNACNETEKLPFKELSSNGIRVSSHISDFQFEFNKIGFVIGILQQQILTDIHSFRGVYIFNRKEIYSLWNFLSETQKETIMCKVEAPDYYLMNSHQFERFKKMLKEMSFEEAIDFSACEFSFSREDLAAIFLTKEFTCLEKLKKIKNLFKKSINSKAILNKLQKTFLKQDLFKDYLFDLITENVSFFLDVSNDYQFEQTLKPYKHFFLRKTKENESKIAELHKLMVYHVQLYEQLFKMKREKTHY